MSLPEIIADNTPVTREKIMALQESMMAAGPGLDLPVRHFFANGLYGRELFIPAGVCAVGKIHKYEQITTVMGDATFATPGEEPVRITGYEIMSTPAGVKRAVFAHADTWVTTFHAVPDFGKDVQAIEAHLIAPSFEALAQFNAEQLEVKP